MSARMVCALFLAAAASLMPARLHATPVTVTLTMGDLPNQFLNGLVHPQGVTFGYTVGGVGNNDARYNAGGPGIRTYVQDPSIEGGTAGVLSLLFAAPTPILEFGAARNVNATLPSAATVRLFDAGDALLHTLPLSLATTGLFAEGRFTYSGDAVKRATVDFTTTPVGTGGQRFAFDNLTFAVVPEPGAALLATVSAAGIGLLRGVTRRRGD